MADRKKSELHTQSTKSSSRSHLSTPPPKTAKAHGIEIRTYHTATLKNIRTRARRSPSIPSHKISKKGKKKTAARPITRRSIRKADGEEQQNILKEQTTGTTPSPPLTGNHTHNYAQEIGRINNIIQSVVKPVTASDKGQHPPADEIVRPLSADELGQLLQSIGNVATIHEDNMDVSTTTTNTNIGGTQAEEQSVEESPEGPNKKRKSKSRKSRRVHHRGSSMSSQKSLKLSTYIPLLKQGNSRQSAGKEAGGKLSKEQVLINSKGSGKRVTSYILPSSRNPVKKIKSMKSQVKALIKEEIAAEKSKSKTSSKSKRRRRKGSRSSSKDLGDEQSADQVESELDLIKTAILNKRYYEESVALAQSNSKENVHQRETTREIIEGVLKKGKRGGRKSSGEKKKVSYAASLDKASELSIGSKLEQLRSVKKKTQESVEVKTVKPVLKSDEKPTTPVPAAAGNKSKKGGASLPSSAETEADKKKYLKDILVNQSHVTKQPESGIPGKDTKTNRKKIEHQFSEDGKVYFTQKFETAPRFNVMNAELHDDNLKFKEFVEKNKPIQKIVQGPNNTRGKTPNNATTGDGASNDRNRKLQQGEHEIRPHTYQISELYSIKKGHMESPVRLRNIDSIWQQQSVYPSAYPSVVNRGRSGRFGEERWSSLNQRTVKKNEELKERRVESGDVLDVTRRIHLATHKRMDVDDENKILDSFATYMKRPGSAKKHQG